MTEVLAALRLCLEPENIPIENAPVRQAIRYFENRPEQFKYQESLAANLPIGSGEVESAHRYIIQKRLKLPGAWWTIENIQDFRLHPYICISANMSANLSHFLHGDHPQIPCSISEHGC